VERYRKEIEQHYPIWLQIAYNLTKNKEQAIDLVHEVLVQIFSTQDKEIVNIRNYVSHSISLSWKSPRSAYHYKYTKVLRSYVELKSHHHKTTEVDYSSRVINEYLDFCISRLPEFEREVFYLYALNDFSYQKLSDETGIPKKVLQRAVASAKNKLYNSIDHDKIRKHYQ
jgi:RNA polymerase sigma factor (sigma-70 family)